MSAYKCLANIILIVISLSLIIAQSPKSNSVESICKSALSRYRKCAVPSFRFGNCSLESAVAKLGTVLRGVDGKFKAPSYRTITQQILKAGYNSIEYNVKNDGYILSAFRIIKNSQAPLNCEKPPLILHHGASTNCASWVYPSAEDGIVWRLVEAGFDVWLTCARGTMYSDTHVTLTSRKSAYWNYDIDDLGSDAGKWVDYILEVTKCPSLTYVGHSMGTTAIFSLLSLQPEYNKKISHYFPISAAVFQSYSTFFITPVASFECSHLLVSNYLVPSGYNLNAPFPGKFGTRLYREFMPYICGASEAQGYICGAASFAVFGCEFSNTDYKMVANSFPFFLDNLSFKAYRHASQNIAMKDFCRFDYGPVKNMKHYSSCQPPCYDLGRITTNITIFELSNDGPVGHKDVVRLMENLKNIENKEVVRVPGARNHLDCLVGNNPKFYVDTILQRLGL